jgi:G:T/U-mismatch repair DNA glycosylase
MTETNPFRYFIPPDPRILILGSFPCFNGKDYGHFFYSGSGRNHFWQLLGDVYDVPAKTLAEKKELCKAQGIALSDIAYRIRRKKGDCSDSNLHILQFNTEGVQKCLNAGVSRVYFTSRFVQKHFESHFPFNKIPALLLPSPSPAANRHIGGLSEYKQLFLNGDVLSAYDYRLQKYKELLLT